MPETKFSMLRQTFQIEKNYVATQHSKSAMKNMQNLSRHRISLLRQRKLEVKVNVVATKTTIVAIEREENTRRLLRHINGCCGIIMN